MESSLHQARNEMGLFSSLGWFSDATKSGRSTVSSLLAVGLSQRELSTPPALTRCLPTWAYPSLSTGPSPAGRPFGSASDVARGNLPPPFVLTAFLSTVPHSDSWQRLSRKFARAYILPYLRVALGRRLSSLLLALSSASAPPSQPSLPFGPYQVSRGPLCLFSTVSPAHTMVRWGGTRLPSPP